MSRFLEGSIALADKAASWFPHAKPREIPQFGPLGNFLEHGQTASILIAELVAATLLGAIAGMTFLIARHQRKSDVNRAVFK